MDQNTLDAQFARKIEDGFSSQTTLKRLRLNFSEFELKNPGAWIADTATSDDGCAVYDAFIKALFSGFNTQTVQCYYQHSIIKDFKKAFSDETQARKNQGAIDLLLRWRTRKVDADGNLWDQIKLELEDNALSNRRRF